MADRPKHLADSALQFRGAGSFGEYVVPQWSTNDTITLGDFTTITGSSAVRTDTSASVTTTNATNQVTLTQATMTNVEVIVFVWGTR